MAKLNNIIIDIKNLSVKYSRAEDKALNNINYLQSKGEKILLMGKTGAGKSTFCLCLKGIIPFIIPADIEGIITINNKKITKPEISVGLVLQEFEAQIFNSTIELEIAFGLQNLGIERAKMREIVQDSIKKLNLTSYEKASPYHVSGGQKQRLAIASIWAMKPEIFILDEPLTDLDTDGRKIVFELICQLGNEGSTIILVDNDLENALFFDKICIMDKGQIVIIDEPSNIIKNSDKFINFGIRPPTHISILKDLNLPYQNSTSLSQSISILQNSLISNPEVSCTQPAYKTSQQSILIFDNVYFQYPNSDKGVYNINLEIKKGEFIGLIGANGSGKTTLLKLMTGILTPASGKIFLNNMQPHKLPPHIIPQVIGFVFQNPDYQLFTNNVKEELIYCMKSADKFHNDYEAKIKQMLKIIKMEEAENKDPFLLTKGERQKIAVATALINEPDIIILDEPSTGLDYQEQLSILQLLKELHQNDKTIIITTHSLWIVEEYAERCIILKDGKIIANDAVQNVFSSTDLFLQANLFPPDLSIICKNLNIPFMPYNDLIKCLSSIIKKHS
jgi:energy-coupling factor transport system ATP-binding protein